VVGALRACRMWHINFESAEFGSPIMTLRKVAAEIYYVCTSLLERLLLICSKTITDKSVLILIYFYVLVDDTSKQIGNLELPNFYLVR
jgi:hypothetical protein